MQVRPQGYIIFALLGAVVGIYTLTPITDLLLHKPDIGVVLGSIFGPGVFVLLLSFLVEHHLIIRGIQQCLSKGLPHLLRRCFPSQVLWNGFTSDYGGIGRAESRVVSGLRWSS